MNSPIYVAVWTNSGIIEGIEIGPDPTILMSHLITYLADNFDRETDDARIFDQNGNEIASYDDGNDDDDDERFPRN